MIRIFASFGIALLLLTSCVCGSIFNETEKVRLIYGRSSNRDAWFKEACPAELAAYNCYFQNMTERAIFLEQMLTLNFTFEDHQKLTDLMGTGNFHMIGDSLMMQKFVSFTCYLYSTRENANYSMIFKYRNWLGDKNCPWGDLHCEALTGSCLWIKNQSICFHWTQFLFEIEDVMKMLNLTKSDNVIMGMGLWYNNKTEHRIDVKRLPNLIENEWKVPRIFWVETSPQHYPFHDAGYYHHNWDAKYNAYVRAFVRGGDEFRLMPCQPYEDQFDARMFDWRNYRTNHALQNTSVAIVRIRDELAKLHFAHVVFPRRNPPTKGLDCTHWCLPGPLQNIFLKAFLHALENHPKGSYASNAMQRN